MTRHTEDRIFVPGEGGIALRPGVVFPDWSAIRSAAAGDVLRAITGAFGVETRWHGYGGDEGRVHVALLDLYARHGRAPTAAELAASTGITMAAVTEILTRLADRDMVVLDPAGGSVTGAYPLTERKTGHRVMLGNRMLNAMCAIDALGTGAMYGVDSRIESSCRHCGAGIGITTKDRGAVLAGASPPETVVLAGNTYESCAANSLCTVITFFCCDEHLDLWRLDNNPGTPARRLALDEALQVGRALFGPFLAGVTADSMKFGEIR